MTVDSYTGEVTVGGELAVRRLPHLTIAKLAVGPMSNNAYLLRCTATGEGLLIDAADEADRLAGLVRFEGPPVSAILTTHRHPDHWQALAATVADAQAAVYAGEPDADELPVAVDERLSDGDTLTVGDLSLHIIALRGHTPGSVAVLYHAPGGTAHLFTGDSLFPGEVRPTSPPCSTTCSTGSSTGLRTAPGFTPATAGTARSAPNGISCQRGANAAGDRPPD